MPLLRDTEPGHLLFCPQNPMVREMRQAASRAPANQAFAPSVPLPKSALVALPSFVFNMGGAGVAY